jgi:hypothetical protein
MLSAVKLNNEACGVAGKIDDVPLDPDLSSEMRAEHLETTTQMPPKLALRFGWIDAHPAGKLALR